MHKPSPNGHRLQRLPPWETNRGSWTSSSTSRKSSSASRKTLKSLWAGGTTRRKPQRRALAWQDRWSWKPASTISSIKLTYYCSETRTLKLLRHLCRVRRARGSMKSCWISSAFTHRTISSKIYLASVSWPQYGSWICHSTRLLISRQLRSLIFWRNCFSIGTKFR